MSETMQQTEHIEDCPFCGDDARLETILPENSYRDEVYYVACSSCGATGPNDDDKYKAIEKWNRPKAVIDNAAAALTLLDENRQLDTDNRSQAAELAALREAASAGMRLLEALRMENGVGNILGEQEREVYRGIESQLRAALNAPAEGE